MPHLQSLICLPTPILPQVPNRSRGSLSAMAAGNSTAAEALFGLTADKIRYAKYLVVFGAISVYLVVWVKTMFDLSWLSLKGYAPIPPPSARSTHTHAHAYVHGIPTRAARTQARRDPQRPTHPREYIRPHLAHTHTRVAVTVPGSRHVGQPMPKRVGMRIVQMDRTIPQRCEIQVGANVPTFCLPFAMLQQKNPLPRRQRRVAP